MFLEEMGARILRRRKELGLSQDMVAELAGLTTQTISTAERGVKALRPENIVKLCAVLDVTPNYLLLGEMGLLAESDVLRMERLTPTQRICLDVIIDNYLTAVTTLPPEAK